MNFGKRLKKLREEKGITQQNLAEYLGVGRPTIAGYETKNKEPDFEKLTKIADYFRVSTDYLLGRTDNRYYLPQNITASKIAESTKEYKISQDCKNNIDLDDIIIAAHDENSNGLTQEEEKRIRSIVRDEIVKLRSKKIKNQETDE